MNNNYIIITLVFIILAIGVFSNNLNIEKSPNFCPVIWNNQVEDYQSEETPIACVNTQQDCTNMFYNAAEGTYDYVCNKAQAKSLIECDKRFNLILNFLKQNNSLNCPSSCPFLLDKSEHCSPVNGPNNSPPPWGPFPVIKSPDDYNAYDQGFAANCEVRGGEFEYLCVVKCIAKSEGTVHFACDDDISEYQADTIE